MKLQIITTVMKTNQPTCVQNKNVSRFIVPEIRLRPQKFKMGHVTLITHILGRLLSTANT